MIPVKKGHLSAKFLDLHINPKIFSELSVKIGGLASKSPKITYQTPKFFRNYS